MKKISIFVGIIIFAIIQNPWNVYGQEVQSADSLPGAQIAAAKTNFDFGDIYQGQKVEHDFEISNLGDKPLVISNVISTCGCTAPVWPGQPIDPGHKAIIKIVFDTSAKMGRQHKVITIRSNAETGDFRLRISAMVLPSKSEQN